MKEPSFKWDDFYPFERDASMSGGKVYGVPALVDNLALVYNKKVFDAAGVAYPSATWTWDDFRTAAKKLTDTGRKQYGWAYVADGFGGHDLAVARDALAGGRRPPVGRRHEVGLRLTGRAEGDATAARHGRDRQVGLPRPGQRQLPQPVQLRQDRDAVDRTVGPVEHQLRRQLRRPGPARRRRHPLEHRRAGQLDAVRQRFSSRQKAAWTFLTWLTSTETHGAFTLATGDLPTRASETTGAGYAKFVAKYPGDAVFVINLGNVTKARPNTKSYPQVSQAIGSQIQGVLIGHTSPQDALKQAASQADAALSSGQ